MRRLLLMGVFFAFGGLSFLNAQDEDPASLAKASLVSEVKVAKPGSTIWVALRFEMAPHWHLGWAVPGDNGLPTTVEWEVPPGVMMGELHFPVPSRFEYEGFVLYVHEGTFHLLTPVSIPADWQVGEPVELKAKVSSSVCSDTYCKLLDQSFSLTLATGDAVVFDERQKPDFAKARSHFPHPLPEGVQGTVYLGEKEIFLRLTGAGLTEDDLGGIYFFSGDDLVEPSKPQKGSLKDGAFELSMVRKEFSEEQERFRGVFVAENELTGDTKTWQIDFGKGALIYDNTSRLSGIGPGDSVSDAEIVDDDFDSLWVLLGLVLVSMAAWVYGKWATFSAPVSTRRKAWVVALVILAGGVWLGYPKEASDTLSWEKWTPERERELLEKGKAVYVDYTANWCLSCQVNKRVFSYESVIQKVREKDIFLLKADWTKKGPVILDALQSHGRQGVPLNVYHKAVGPGERAAKPILLPEALTEDIVLEVLETGKPYLQSDDSRGYVALLGFAFLGGLILNLMPCVFPVLGLKIMGFVGQAGEDRKSIAGHGLVFTGGVLASFWVLVGILLWLRDSMENELGWGFQLQEPAFVFVLAVLLLIFALSLSGVFEIGVSLTGTGSELARKPGHAGSFFSGVLATVVATPCMAPFLGVAVGAALTMEWFSAFLVFTCVALGLALPYLLLSIFPGWINRLPKPGSWMESFKQAMAFPLYATVVWLIWVLWSQS